MAINIVPGYTLAEWGGWLRQYTDERMIWASDPGQQAVTAFGINAVGTKVIIDPKGRVVHRSAGIAGYDILDSVVRKAL